MAITKEAIQSAIEVAVQDFLYQRRIGDSKVPPGAIEKSIKDGIFPKEEMINDFIDVLNKYL